MDVQIVSHHISHPSPAEPEPLNLVALSGLVILS